MSDKELADLLARAVELVRDASVTIGYYGHRQYMTRHEALLSPAIAVVLQTLIERETVA